MDPTPESAKKEVERLVYSFKQLSDSGSLKRYNEEDTKRVFITPLFRALGWDVETSGDEVTNEDRISKGRVDYAFRINGIPKFFLEAKAANKGIDEAKDSLQAINYAWHKGTTWAVLTDFQTLIIYNAEVKEKNLSDARFVYLTCDQFAEQFHKLWWLSKQAFQEGLLDKEALSWGKKLRKTKVDEQLLQELTRYRELLSKNIVKNNNGVSEEEVDECVQRIIDRLIFIRTTEDRNIEPPILITHVREFEEGKRGKLSASLNETYLQFDKTYNSKLFTFNHEDDSKRHLLESLDIDNEVLIKVIRGMYQSENTITTYNFSLIDADILGNIYEQYLSHILKKTAKRAKVESKEVHRKEQGIYYTPTYIVDYIVKNTLGEVLKNKKPNDVDKIKVLDMACGSGSFLIKAFDVLDEYYKKHEKDYGQTKLDIESESAKITRKTKILKNNIYGVDLDPKAVEIAQLNLLLKAAETRHLLPDLRENIKKGNSLIDSQEIVGDNALNWNQFLEKERTDVIVGNPPYVRNTELPITHKQFYAGNYLSAEKQYDLYVLFIERALMRLKENGLFGYIVPNKVLSSDYASKLRKLILENCEIVNITDVSELNVFKDAATYPIILFLRKRKPSEKNKVTIQKCKTIEDLLKGSTYTIEQRKFIEQGNQFLIHADDKTSKILSKIEKNSIHLGDIFEVRKGIETGNDRERTLISEKSPTDKTAKPVLGGASTINRYNLHWNNRYVLYDPKKLNGARKPEYFERPKFVTGRTVKRLSFALDLNNFYTLDTTQIIFTNKDVNLFAVLGLINSKAINFYYSTKFKDSHMRGGYIRCYTNYLEKIPLKLDVSELSIVSKLVKELLDKYEKTNRMTENTENYLKLYEEIKTLEKKIDTTVYEMFGLSSEEVAQIETYHKDL